MGSLILDLKVFLDSSDKKFKKNIKLFLKIEKKYNEEVQSYSDQIENLDDIKEKYILTHKMEEYSLSPDQLYKYLHYVIENCLWIDSFCFELCLIVWRKEFFMGREDLSKKEFLFMEKHYYQHKDQLDFIISKLCDEAKIKLLANSL